MRVYLQIFQTIVSIYYNFMRISRVPCFSLPIHFFSSSARSDNKKKELYSKFRELLYIFNSMYTGKFLFISFVYLIL